MVDLGISRTQDVQNSMGANSPVSRVPPEGQERATRPPVVKSARRTPSEEKATESRPADIEGEVKRLNDLLGSSTQIQFVINRRNNDIYIEVVDKESNKVLKTIPPSELPAIAGKLGEGGILVDSMS